MKYILSIFMLAMLSVGSIYAEQGSTTSPYKEVQKFEGEFEVILNDDNTVTASWDSFDGEGFDWYKLMYSTTQNNPVYPNDHVAFVGSADQTQATFKLKYGKKHYIRICAITLEEDYKKGRYCSEVTMLEVENIASVKNYTAKKTTAAKQYQETKEVNKQEMRDKSQVKKAQLTDKLIDRIDGVLEKFIARLESKGYSDEKKLAAIDRIISKLETLKEKKQRYIRIVDYMIEVLEEYRSEIDDDFSDIESIFEDF